MSLLTVHQLVPNQGRRAAQEAQRAGVKFHAPKQRIDGKARRLLHGYALLSGHVRDSLYIRRAVGCVQSSQLRPLYDIARAEMRKGRNIKAKASEPFKAGDTVSVIRGTLEGAVTTIVEIRNSTALLNVMFCGKPVRIAVNDLRRHHPPTR